MNTYSNENERERENEITTQHKDAAAAVFLLHLYNET